MNLTLEMLDEIEKGCDGVTVGPYDHMGGELLPHHNVIIRLLGQERADAIMTHVREHNGPPKARKLREPNYARPTIQ